MSSVSPSLPYKSVVAPVANSLPSPIELKRPSKPPILSDLCCICRKIGKYMPKHYEEVIKWSKSISEHNTRWDGHLICAEALTIDKTILSPSSGTALFDVLVVHRELFIGFD